jgi:hypothetical protein
MVARLTNLMLGLWLFLSAFSWPHPGASGFITWTAGLLIACVSILTMAFPAARWANVVLGLWVMVAAFIFHQDNATLWNNLVVGLCVFIAAPVHTLAQDLAPSRSSQHA